MSLPSHRLPPALRRGLTFWRRSIQARVVVSTRRCSRPSWSASSAGSCSSRPATGCSRTGSTPWSQEAEGETTEAPRRAGRRARHRRRRVRPAAGRWSSRSSVARRRARLRRGAVAAPVGDGRRLADGGAKFTQGLDIASVPETLEARFDPARRHGLDLHRHPHHADRSRACPTAPGIVVGSQVRLPGRRRHLHALLPLPARRASRRRSRWCPGAARPPACLLLLLVAGLTWLVTRQVVDPDPDGPPGRRAAGGRASSRSGCGSAARTTWRGWRRRSTRWPPTCSARSASSRSSAGSSGASSPTSPTSCARRSPPCGWPATCSTTPGPSFDPVTARAAELLQTELDRFETLLADLLEISRFDAGAAVLEAEDVDLVDVARRVVDMTRALADAARHPGRGATTPGTPCLAEADVRRVERIVRNLVTNAIDHAETPRRS